MNIAIATELSELIRVVIVGFSKLELKTMLAFFFLVMRVRSGTSCVQKAGYG